PKNSPGPSGWRRCSPTVTAAVPSSSTKSAWPGAPSPTRRAPAMSSRISIRLAIDSGCGAASEAKRGTPSGCPAVGRIARTVPALGAASEPNELRLRSADGPGAGAQAGLDRAVDEPRPAVGEVGAGEEHATLRPAHLLVEARVPAGPVDRPRPAGELVG